MKSCMFLCKRFVTPLVFGRVSRRYFQGRFSKKRTIALSEKLRNMADPAIETALRPLRESVKEQVNLLIF